MGDGYKMVARRGQNPTTEQRVVMERHIGRPLLSDEHVHHINGDKRDNRIENLEIMDPREHTRLHHYGVPKKPGTRSRIVALRDEGLTQAEIAAAVSLDRSTVNRHLRAASGNPRPAWRPKGGFSNR